MGLVVWSSLSLCCERTFADSSAYLEIEQALLKAAHDAG